MGLRGIVGYSTRRHTYTYTKTFTCTPTHLDGPRVGVDGHHRQQHAETHTYTLTYTHIYTDMLIDMHIYVPESFWRRGVPPSPPAVRARSPTGPACPAPRGHGRRGFCVVCLICFFDGGKGNSMAAWCPKRIHQPNAHICLKKRTRRWLSPRRPAPPSPAKTPASSALARRAHPRPRRAAGWRRAARGGR